MNNLPLEKAHSERDLGVLISDDLKVSGQCSQAYLKANRMLGLYKKNHCKQKSGILWYGYTKLWSDRTWSTCTAAVVATLSER